MSNEDNVIDAEVVETANLPARVETHRSDDPIEAQRDWPHGPVPERRCVAHRKNGDQCKNAAIKGATVCRYHGGSAPAVRNAAKVRLEKASDRMAKQLLGIATDETVAPETRLKAVINALDRTIGRAPTTVEVGPIRPAFETVFESIGGDPAVAGFPSAAIGEGISAGASTSPAPAYPGYADDEQAEAGSDVAGDADEYGAQSAPTGPPRQPRPRERDRERQPQPGARHITGETAIQVANWANRAMAESHGLPWGESDRRRR